MMLYRYGSFMHRRARLVLLVSFLVVAGAGVLGAGVFGRLQPGGFDDPGSESARAQRLVDERFGGQADLVLVVHAAGGNVDAADARAAGAELVNRLRSEPFIKDPVDYWTTGAPELRSTDGADALILAHVDGDESQRRERTEALIDAYATDGATIHVRAGGAAATNVDVNAQVERSLLIAEAIAVPITLVLLLLVFRSVVSALLPLAIGGVAIVGTFAQLAVLGAVTDVSVFAINLTTALGLGLGIDYALLMVTRYREELARADKNPKDPEADGSGPRNLQTVPPARQARSGGGQGRETPHAQALAATVATAGRTILFAAATVATALTALLVFPLYFLRSFAYAGIGVVLVAAFGALVVAPALLAVLGPRIDAGRVFRRRATTQPVAESFWGRLAGAVMRRPALAALPVVLGLLAVASPLTHVAFGTPDEGVLRPGSAGRVVADRLATGFPSNQQARVEIVLDGPSTEDAVGAYAARLSTLDGTASVRSAAGTYAGGGRVGEGDPALARPDASRVVLASRLAAKSDAAQRLVTAVRATPAPAVALVGGVDAQLIDTKHAIGERLPLGIAVVVLATFALLFLFTGSVVQPLRALALNVLGLGATLGLLTLIFQDGFLSGLLGFTPRPMDTAMTVLLFCIVFGLSMDYEVFIVGRIAELHARGLPTEEAVRAGLGRTGRVVSAAAMLLAVSFFAFGSGSVSFLQLFGIGSGLAVLIDATLIRGVLVPAIMRVLGRANWYSPKPLRRLHASIKLQEA